MTALQTRAGRAGAVRIVVVFDGYIITQTRPGGPVEEVVEEVFDTAAE